MSHVAAVKIEIKSLDDLKAACKDLGLAFREGKKTFKWYGRWVNDFHGSDAAYHHGINPKDYGKCEHAIGLSNNSEAYEVGVIKNPNGPGYILIYDFWNGGYGLEAAVGKNCDKLTQHYAKNVAIKQMKKLGYIPKVKQDNEGNIEVIGVKA